jgi:hypothetical protein
MAGYTPTPTARVYPRVLLATLLFAACGLLLALASEPRRVGDGVEYWAMAEQMRTGHRPSASRGELSRLEREAQAIGRGFDQSPVRFPGLVAADGRQDFPHFWLYPLANVPALTITSLAGLHPNWAFTLTNILLLATAFAVVARWASIEWAVLLLAGPVIWWIDKAHGDVFTVSLLAMACALWQALPATAAVIVAVAAAQNPALMPVAVLVSVTALWRARSRRMLAAVAASAAIVAVPLVYYQVRLGVWSPLVGYTHPALPSVRAMMSLLIDPNIGLLPNAPFLGVAAVFVVSRQARRVSWRDGALAVAACLLMLAAYAQSVNLNHGATPGLNRWTLWLTPWLLVIAAGSGSGGASGGGTAAARVLLAMGLLNAAWAGWFFRPSVAEGYRYPTQAAAWLWTHAPDWYLPAPEIFAERVSHREPATLPVAWPGCGTVLIIDGRWPTSCIPTAPTPDACRGAGRLCYATRTSFVALGDVSFPSLPAATTVSGDAPYLSALRAHVPQAGAIDAEAIIRASHGIRWLTAWQWPQGLAIYLEEATPSASLEIRVDDDYRGQLIDLDTNRVISDDIHVARSGDSPSQIVLPTPAAAAETATLPHGLIRLTRGH